MLLHNDNLASHVVSNILCWCNNSEIIILQAAEKSLKAAQYSLDANISKESGLRINALPLLDNDILELATRLESLLGDSRKMQYPDNCQQIPHMRYDESAATSAQELTREILEQVKAFLIRNSVIIE